MCARLLVVDDEPNILVFCQRVLARRGYEVHTADSGESALALMQGQPYDLLATDIRMPGMSGIELMQRGLELRPDLAVIVITGLNTLDNSVQALRAGAKDFLTKPFGAEELTTAVERALERVQLLRERARLRLLEPLLELSNRALYGDRVEGLARAILEIAVTQTAAAGGALALVEPARLIASGEPSSMPDELWARAIAARPDEKTRLWIHEEAMPLDSSDGRSPLTIVCVALQAPGARVGVLALALPRRPAQVAQSDLELLSVLAGQAAALLDNARLMQSMEEWNRSLEQRVLQRTRELEAAQERLLRAERLATVGQLGSSIAHELRNPLGVISNSVYYLRTFLGDSDPRLERHLQIMERELQASNRIITNLMNFVRVRELQREPVSVAELVQQVLERAQIPPRIHVVVDVPEDLPHAALDPDRMQQVLLNLIDNAVQAMPSGGVLTITGYVEQGALCLAVRDQGEGIPAENLARVFEPLFTTKARGIGLGLAIVKMLVEAHEGSITVESEPEVGSTFTIRLPVALREQLQEELCA